MESLLAPPTFKVINLLKAPGEIQVGMWFRGLRLLLFFIAGLSDGTYAPAATLTWTGAAGDNNINTPGNWSPAQVPATGDLLVFSGSTSLAPQQGSNLSIGSITFASGASPFTLGGAGIYTVGSGGITNSSAAIQTINNAITLGAAQAWRASSGALNFGGAIVNAGFLLTVDGAFNTTLSNTLSGSGGLTKTGTGTLTLGGDNTALSGTVTLTAGTLAIGSNTAAGTGTLSLGKATIQAAGGARSLANTLLLNGNTIFSGVDDLTFTGAASLNKSRTFTVNSTGVITFSGVIGQTGGGGKKLTKTGSGTLVLNGSNTFTGGIVHSAGTLIIGNNAAAGTGALSLGNATIQAGGAARTLSNAVTLAGNTTFSGVNDLTFTGAASVAATRTLTVSNLTTFSGVLSGAGGLTKNGAGTLRLTGTGANTFSGGVSVNDGTLIFGKTAGLNAMAGTLLTVGDGSGAEGSAILQLNTANQIPNATAVTVNADGQLNLQGFIDGIGALTMNGGSVAGTGTSRLDLGGALTVGATGSTVAQITANVGLNANRVFTVNDNAVTTDNDLSISGILSNGSAVSSMTKTGAGTLLLSGANTFTGGSSVINGKLIIDANTALGTGAVNIGDTVGSNSAALLFSTTAGRTVTNAITASAGSSGTLTLGGLNTSGTNTFSGSVTLNKSVTLTAEPGGEVLFSNVISGTGFGVTKIGAGTVRFSGANTYTGLTTINAGTLAYGASNVIATGGVTIDGSAAVLDLGASRTDTVGQIILNNGGAITGSGTSTLSSTASFDLRSGVVTIALGGAVALTKTTAGTVTLSGVNTYTGPTTISEGLLQLGVASSLPSVSAVTVAGGATLHLGGFNQTMGSLAGAGTVVLGSGTLTTGGDNTSTSYSGELSGSGGLTKNGSGIFTVSGANLSTGATTINQGTLRLGAAGGINSGSAVTVASGAIFDPNGFSATIGSLAGAGGVSLGSGTLTAGGNQSSTLFSGVISGTGGLSKAGTGNLTLSGGNTFSGAVAIESGGLKLSGAGGRAASASGFTISTGATLTLDNSAGENADRIGNSAAITLSGGTLQFISDSNGSVETVGVLHASGGSSSIQITHNGAVGDSTSLTFSSLGTIASGATVNFSAIGGVLGFSATGPHIFITGQANGLMGGWATVGSDFAEYTVNGVAAFTGYYTGPDGINVNDPAKIVLLNGTSPSTAYTLTNAGTTTDLGLNLADLASVDLGALSSRTLNLAGGGLIKSTATATTISGAGRLTAGGTANGTLSVSVDASHFLTISSSIIDNGGANGVYGDAGDGVVSLSKGGAGLLVLSGVNTFTGNTFINTGTLQISAENNLGAASNDVIFGGGILSVTSGFTASTGKTFTVTSDLTGTLDIASGQTLTLGNATNVLTSGNTASALYKTGAGSLVMESANAGFDGVIQLDAGIVELRHAQALGDSTNRGRIILNTGTLNLRNDANTSFSNDVTVTASSTVDVGRLSGTSPAVTHTLGALSIGANTLSITGSNGAALNFGAVTLTGNATFNPTSADVSLGAVSGSFGFTKTGGGVLVLNGASNYTGATTINAGTMRLGVAGGVPVTSLVTVASGAFFDLNNLSATIGSLSGAGNVTLGTGTLTTGANHSSTTFSGMVSGTGGLTKTGSGIFTLSGANAYTGATAITAGTLRLSVAGGIPATSTVSVESGATFDLNNFNAAIGSLSGTGSVTLGSGTLTTGGDHTSTSFSGLISGTGGLTKTGSGVFTLSGSHTFTGITSVTSGVLAVQNFSALGGVSGGTVVTSGAELRLLGGISVGAEPLTLNGTGIAGEGALRVLSGMASWSGGITLASSSSIGVDAGQLTLGGTINLGANTLTFAGAGASRSDGIISGSGALIKNGAGVLTLTAANTYTGTTLITAGAVNVQNALAFGANGAGAVTVASGAAIILNNPGGIDVGDKSLTLNGAGISGGGVIDSVAGNHSWAGNITLASNATIAVEADSLTLNGAMGESGGARSLTKTGAGTLIFGGNHSYTGATIINAGTLQIDSSERIGDNSAVTVASGAILNLNEADETIGSLAGAGSVIFGVDLTASLTTGGDGTSTTFSGVLSGTGDFTKTGAGTQILSGANTFTGFVFINQGVLSINADARLGDSTNALDFGGGTLQLTSAMAIGRAINLSGNGTIDTTGVNSTLSGIISGVGSLTKAGGGVLTLTGANTFGGAGQTVSINGGSLQVGADNRLGNSANSVTFNGGTLAYSAGFTTGRNMVLNAGGGTIDTANNAVTLGAPGVISGLGALTKTGIGVLTLSGANTYQGGTILNAGKLSITSNGNLGTGSMQINNGSTLVTNGSFNFTHGLVLGAPSGAVQGDGLAVSGIVDVQSGTLTMITNGITDGGSGGRLMKIGAGTLDLTVGSAAFGGNTLYSGGTYIHEGTLMVSAIGALGSNPVTTFDNGATLLVNVNAGGLASVAQFKIGTGGAVVGETAGKTSFSNGAVSNVSGQAGGITFVGPGKSGMGGNNTFVGTVVIGSPAAPLVPVTLSISRDVNLGAASNQLTIGNGSTLMIEDGIDATQAAGSAAIAATFSMNRQINLTGSTAIIEVRNTGDAVNFNPLFTPGLNTLAPHVNVLTVNGVITGSGQLIKAGPGTLVLGNGGNNYTGGTVINGGILSISDPAALGLSTGVLTINPTGVFQATGSFVSAREIILGGTGSAGSGGTIDVTGSNNATRTGVISGSGSLTKTGTGILTLTAVNTYSGLTVVSAGELDLHTAGGQSIAGDLTVNGGTVRLLLDNQINSAKNLLVSSGTFDVQSFDQVMTSVQLTGGGIVGTTGTLTSVNPFDMQSGSVSAILAGNVALNKTTGGTVTFSGLNTYTGLTTVGGGELDLNTTGGPAIAGDLTVNGGIAKLLQDDQINSAKNLLVSGGTFDVQGFNQLMTNVQLTAGSIIGSTGTLTSLNPFDMQAGSVSAILAGNVALNKTTGGTVTLTGANIYTGLTDVQAGTLILGGTGGTIADSSAVLVRGGTLEVASSDTVGTVTISSGTISGAGILTGSSYNLTDTGTISAVLAGNGVNLTKTGAGTARLTAANTYTGVTDLEEGVLQLSGASGANTGATAYILNGGALMIDNASVNHADRIAGASTIALNGGSFIYQGANAANSTESVGVLSGMGHSTITVSFGGTNLATLTADSFIHVAGNATDLVNGLNLGKDALGMTSTGRFLITNSPTLIGGTAALSTGINMLSKNTQIVPFLVGEATVTSGGSGTVTGVANTFLTYASGSGLRPLNPTDEFTNNAIITGDNTYITVATLAAATTAINSLVINGANLSVSDGVSLTNTSGALLFVSNHSIVPSGTTGIYTSGAEHQITVNAGVTGTISASIDGLSPLTKSGAGTLILSGANTYTGGTNISVGVLSLGSSGALGSTGTISFNGGILQYSGTNTTDYSNRFSTAANQQYDVDTNGQDIVFAGALTSAGGTFTKRGTGKLTLTSAGNTYSGTTTVGEGTLQIDGVIASEVRVNSGATLSGSGSVTKAITISGVGALRPGNKTPTGSEIGTFKLSGSGSDGNLTVATTGTLGLQLGANGIAFSDQASTFYSPSGVLNPSYVNAANLQANANDRIVVGGTLTLTGDSIIEVTLSGYTPSIGDGFDLLDWTLIELGAFAIGPNLRTGADNGLYDLQLPDLTAINSEYYWDVSLFASDGIIVVVPEPSRVMLLTAAFLACFLRRRRSVKPGD